MASGKPDWNRIVTVQGKYNNEWLPMKVDSTGQLYIAITAQEIDVTQLDSDRNIMGDDGGEKRYIAVDGNGVMLARMKGLYDNGLYDVAIDANGVMLSRIQGQYSGSGKDLNLDVNGNIISIMKGLDGSTLRTVYVDATGKMVARIQGATGGDLVVFVIDDCGDNEDISNWVADEDGEDPVETTTFVKEGTKAMLLEINASLSFDNYAEWINTREVGDLTGLYENKLKIAIYFNTLDHIHQTATAIIYRIGSSSVNYDYWSFEKSDLSLGWNTLICDLSTPGGTVGAPDHTDIDYQNLRIYEKENNTDDFYVIVDSMVITKDNPDPGTMKDLNTDAEGFLLTRMVASFGDYLKPLACDRYGSLRINGEVTSLVTRYQTKYLKAFVSNPSVAYWTMLNVAGPGVILGGYCTMHHTATKKINHFRVVLDGVGYDMDTWEEQNDRGITEKDMGFMHLVKYDDTNFRYSFGFARETYFETSIWIRLRNQVIGGEAEWHIMYKLF